jgi:hypothetical protein
MLCTARVTASSYSMRYCDVLGMLKRFCCCLLAYVQLSSHVRASDGFYRSPADAFRAIDQSCVIMMTKTSLIMVVVLFVVAVVMIMMTMFIE